MKKAEIIQQIPNHYVCGDVFQIMQNYPNQLVTFDSDGIIYHSKDGINAYLDHQERNCFPYANIPTHEGKKYFKRFHSVNQIYTFNQSYFNLLSTKDGLPIVTENKGFYENGKAYLWTRLGLGQSVVMNLTRLGLDEYLKKPEDADWQIVLDDEFKMMPPEYTFPYDKILERYKDNVRDCYAHSDYTRVNTFNYRFDGLARSVLLKHIDELTFDDFPKGYFYIKPFYVINKNTKGIHVKKLDVTIMGNNAFQTQVTKIDSREFLPELKYYLGKIKEMREPVIPTKLNPDIPLTEIEYNQVMVRERKKKGY